MFDRIVADSVVCIHFFFILFVVLGGFLLFRYRWLMVFHLPAVIWGTLIECNGWACPLTRLEKMFRLSALEADYSGGFIDRYLIPVIYPSGLNREVQMVLGSMVILINLAIYTTIIVRQYKKV